MYYSALTAAEQTPPYLQPATATDASHVISACLQGRRRVRTRIGRTRRSNAAAATRAGVEPELAKSVTRSITLQRYGDIHHEIGSLAPSICHVRAAGLPSPWQASGTTNLRFESRFGYWSLAGSSSSLQASASPGAPSRASRIWRDRYSDLDSAATATRGGQFVQLPVEFVLWRR